MSLETRTRANPRTGNHKNRYNWLSMGMGGIPPTLLLFAALLVGYAQTSFAADTAATDTAATTTVAATSGPNDAATSSADAGTDQAAAAGTQLAEVIVTAQRRAQAEINVPETLSVLPESTLTQLDIRDFQDYASMVPTLSFNEGGNGGNIEDSNRITIRGVVGANTTSMYIDDTPIPSNEDPRVIDVARIEVLEGPQGTLYGASAIGGTIRIITNQPSLTQDISRYMLTSGQTENAGSENYGGTAIANMVVYPNVFAVRLMGFIDHEGGYVTRTYPSTEPSVGYTPGIETNGTDVGAPGSLRFSDGNTGEQYEYGGSISASWQASDNFLVNLKLLTQESHYPDGFPIVYRGLPQVEPTSLTVNREYDVQESALDNWVLPALTLTYTRPTWSFLSEWSEFHQNTSSVQDVSEAEHELFNQAGYDYYDNFGSILGGSDASNINFINEERFTWNPRKSFDWIVGIYYEHDQANSNSLPRQFPTILGLNLPDTGLITNDIYYASNGINTTENEAIYTNLDYTLFNTLTVTAGVRKYYIYQIQKATNVGFIIDDETPVNSRYYLANQGLSPRFALSLQPNDSTNVYGSAARGFRQGGGAGYVISIQCYPELAAIGLTPQDIEAGYKPDTVWTYELGDKQSLFDHRLLVSSAIYDTQWTGIQQNVTLGSCGQHFTTNAGDAQIKGAEIQVAGNIGHLTLQAEYGYTNGRITNSAGGTTTQPVGARIYDVPEATASMSATYRHQLTARVTGFLSADWKYTGGWLSSNNSATVPAYVEPYEIANVRLGADVSANEYTVYVKNVTNRLAALGDAIPPVDRTTILDGKTIPYERMYVSTPRTVGVEFRHGF